MLKEEIGFKKFYTTPVTLIGNDTAKKRQEILHYFRKTFELFEALFEMFKQEEAFYLRPEPTRHPMIFYYGHTAAFYINKLILAKLIEERINPRFEALFAVGVDEMAWDDMNQGHYDWPSVEEVRAYRKEVKRCVEEMIESLPLTLPIDQKSPFWIILMGIEHERIHIETSSVLHRQMPLEYIEPSNCFSICSESSQAPQNDLVSVSGGRLKLGKERNHHLYGWDNEYGTKTVEVDDFKVSKYLVSNGEFLPFVLEGGYENKRWWCEEGRAFLQRRGAKYPPFWVRTTQGEFRYRTMMRLIDMPWDWPVEVNALEAEAFCRWKGEKEGKAYRLPSEAEWYRLYEIAKIKDVPDFDDKRANTNLRHFASSCPVNRFAFGEIYDVVGNVWQWTSTPIEPFEGFEPHYAYDDFSTPTFDTMHNLIKGGSWISTGNEIMKHSRYAFRRHFYQHAGFRYVEDASGAQQNASKATRSRNIYEGDVSVAQYCEFHYGESYFGVENFAKVCADLAIAYTKKTSCQHALDLGCATGRASFELAKAFKEVTGIDFSARFIAVATRMREEGEIAYAVPVEGDLTEKKRAVFKHFKGANVTFWQGDACNLKPRFKGYDLVLAANLIDRLYDPELFLKRIHERIVAGGYLVLTSPYTWMEEYTPKKKWLGGFKNGEGKEVRTLERIKAILSARFDLVDTRDIPFVIRETKRKFQHTLAQMSVWEKRI